MLEAVMTLAVAALLARPFLTDLRDAHAVDNHVEGVYAVTSTTHTDNDRRENDEWKPSP